MSKTVNKSSIFLLVYRSMSKTVYKSSIFLLVCHNMSKAVNKSSKNILDLLTAFDIL